MVWTYASSWSWFVTSATSIALSVKCNVGLHRYVFLLYEQQGRVSSVGEVEGFDVSTWASMNNLRRPVAGNYFQAEEP
jgi:hypothetical protein